jgi:hypothetical protein
MAHYEHLPIYKSAMDVAVYFETIVKNFSRYHKYTLGSELRTMSRKIIKQIIQANSASDKLPLLHELRGQLEELKVAIRIAKEVQAFKSFKSFQQAIEGVVSVSKQNEGWIKSLPVKRGEGQKCL